MHTPHIQNIFDTLSTTIAISWHFLLSLVSIFFLERKKILARGQSSVYAFSAHTYTYIHTRTWKVIDTPAAQIPSKRTPSVVRLMTCSTDSTTYRIRAHVNCIQIKYTALPSSVKIFMKGAKICFFFPHEKNSMCENFFRIFPPERAENQFFWVVRAYVCVYMRCICMCMCVMYIHIYLHTDPCLAARNGHKHFFFENDVVHLQRYMSCWVVKILKMPWVACHVFHKRATNYTALLQQMTYADKASYDWLQATL